MAIAVIDDFDNLNDRLKALFGEDRFTVAALSKVLGVSRQTVYNYLEGRTEIDLKKIYKICDAFNLPLELFIRGSEMEEMKETIEKLEFILKNLLLEKWSLEKKTNAPNNIYDFPEVQAQITMYKLSKDPLYGVELEKAMKLKGKKEKTTKPNESKENS